MWYDGIKSSKGGTPSSPLKTHISPTIATRLTPFTHKFVRIRSKAIIWALSFPCFRLHCKLVGNEHQSPLPHKRKESTSEFHLRKRSLFASITDKNTQNTLRKLTCIKKNKISKKKKKKIKKHTADRSLKYTMHTENKKK